ncbi:MAG: MMPL family transporter [Planctomycetaceae bacterium]|nr:MMPL family transporter [Planctomycetaceae bacterium]
MLRRLVSRPTALSLVFLVTSVVCSSGYLRPEWLHNAWSQFFEETPSTRPVVTDAFDTPPDVDPVSLSESSAVIVAQSDQFFTRRGAQAMRHVVERLEELDYVAGILWMDRVPVLNIFGLQEPLYPRGESTEERYAATREKARRHPLVHGQLLSEDGRTQLLMVTFDWHFIRSDEQCMSGLREAAERAAAEFPDVRLEFLVTGFVPAQLTAMQAHESNQVRYQVIGYGIVVLMAVLLFRGVRAVLIVVLAPITGLIWTLGLLKSFHIGFNPFIDVILPVLILLVGMTDGVHLMVQIRRLQASGMSAAESITTAVQQVGMACFLTSLTTGIGFSSLLLSDQEWVRTFGWASVLGVSMMFLAVITVIPLACRTPLGRNIHVGSDRSLIDRNLSRIGGLIEFVMRRRISVSVLAVLSTLLLVAVSLTLRPDERRANALPSGSEAHHALQVMDRNLGGLEFSEVLVTWTADVAFDSREVLQVISAVDDLLHTEELIGYPLSLRNLLDSLPGDRTAADRMGMAEVLPPQLKRAFYTPEYRQANVTFRVQDLGIARFGPVFERIETGLRGIEERHPQFSLKLQGSAVWRWKNLYRMVIDLAKSLGSAALVIMLVMAMSFRSVRLGLISVVPNAFPLAATGTWLVVSDEKLELVSVLAFTVCLGIAVDDTIHFLTRYCEEAALGHDRDTAIRRAFSGVGVALVMTTTVLVAGFASVSFSDSRDHRIFATMGGLTILSALFGDLVFLPALLSMFAPKAGSAPSREESQSSVGEAPAWTSTGTCRRIT